MINEFLNFVKASPTAYHACDNLAKMLKENGFKEISETEKWDLKKGGKYYLTRNGSCLVAFTIPSDIKSVSYNISAAHLDSPTFKLKPNFTITSGKYLKLNTEVYGGPILNTWMDRPLNIAGRVIVKTDSGLEVKLLSFDKAMCMIPNCSIHYYHELNTGVKLNPQIDLLPIYSDSEVNLKALMSSKLNVKEEDIISYDLYLALLDRGMLVGANNEFVMAPQIDNLECAYGIYKSLISAKNTKAINVICEFDNEEIGSRTFQGAASTMLSVILERISSSLNLSNEEHNIALLNSFMVSADNAQGYHPNYPSKFDPTNASFMNSGIVIKNAARGSYSTDAFSSAYFTSICNLAGAKVQMNTNRSDIPGGSTLGCISLGNVSIHSVDIGLPQIAMHSAYETAGAYDLCDFVKALTKFYELKLEIEKDKYMKF